MEYFKILPLAKRRVISDICHLHKILNNGIDCPYLLSKVNINVPIRANPRHCMYFNIPFCRTNKYRPEFHIDKDAKKLGHLWKIR
nr:unnamed protein product [Callosobruchus chinensis]